MQHKQMTWSERMLRRERLRRMAESESPDPFLDKISEVTLLGIGTVMVGMAALGSVLEP